ncbi:MAG: glycosyltransferase [Thermoleophilia bacterium]
MTGPLRVVDVTQCYSPTSGGIRTYLHAKARWAAAAGTHHAVVATGPRDGRAVMSSSQLILVRGRTPTRRWGYRLALRPAGVLRALDELRPHVVVVHDALAFPHSVAEWARANRAGLALMCHSHLAAAVAGFPRGMRPPLGAALAVVQRRAFAVGEVVMVASRHLLDAVSAEVTAPVRVNPLGIDVDVFGAARPDQALRHELGAGDAPLLLYAGRLSSEKRVELLVDMLARLPGRHVLALAGDGAMRARLVRRAAARGVESRMRLLGHIADRATLASLMATADCFVHPTPGEPFGLAPAEAAAAGCRVVAPRTVGCHEVLERRGTGGRCAHRAVPAASCGRPRGAVLGTDLRQRMVAVPGPAPVTARALVLSIHDVAPPTMEACVELRRLVHEALGDVPVSLLVVPRLHGHRLWDGASAGWLCDRITLGDEPVLHGLYHEDALGRDGREFGRGLMPSTGATAVRRGLADLGNIGVLPVGFIAPAYGHPRGLHHALRTSGLGWWCTRLRLHARGGAGRLLPSVGLGASTPWRRLTSPSATRGALAALPACGAVRLDLHPADLRHARLRGALEVLLAWAGASGRRASTHGALLG